MMRALVRRCAAEGLFEKRPGLFALYATSHVLTCAAGFWGMIHASGMGTKILFSVLWGAGAFQLGAWMHDLAHYSVTRSRALSDLLGLIAGNGFNSIDYLWWQEKHNRHHRDPNNADRDPDHFFGPYFRTIDRGPLSPLNYLGGEHLPASPLLRLQGYYLWLLGLLGSVNFTVQSLQFLFRRQNRRLEAARIALTLLHYGVFLALLTGGGVSLGKSLLLFVCGRLSVGGFFVSLGMLNHLGMNTYRQEDREPRFFARQVTSSRNLDDSWLSFYLTGGLNHHIEHHLFPSMSRFQHPALARHVRALCREHGIEYRMTSFLQGLLEVTTYMNRVGASALTPPTPSTPLRPEEEATRC